MKKGLIIFLSVLMVLFIGQAAFAKGNISLSLGYVGAKGSEQWYEDEDNWWEEEISAKGFSADLSASFYLIDKFSLVGNLNVESIKETEKYLEMWDGNLYDDIYNEKYTNLYLSLFGRYDLFNLDIATIGVQLGVINGMQIDEGNSDPRARAIAAGVYAEGMTMAIAAGIYGNVNVMPKLDVYADLKFPLVAFHDDKDISFFGAFFYDVTIGATYEIYKNVNLGLEGNINNSTVGGIAIALDRIEDKKYDNDDTGGRYFNFSIGAKVGYSF